MSRQGRRADDPPAKRLTIGEAFADLSEGGRLAGAKRDLCRLVSPGEPPARLWRWGGRTVAARTRSEARARLKRLDHLRRLPAGESPEEVRS